MKLSFFVNEDKQLESSNIRGCVIDENQSVGTMYGLQNQLVLHPKDRAAQELSQSRTVLIPHGHVKFSAQGNHSRVEINTGGSPNVVLHQYKIDGDLGYLAGNTNLTSRLFKIYLHALTSYCLPDPLTGRTGTEEALYELSEPATSSFDQINKQQAHLLGLIGALTPRRHYHPTPFHHMQQTHWLDLSYLAQHYAFCTIANSILKRASTLHLFSPLACDLTPDIIMFDTNYDPKFHLTLLKRAAHRTSMYYPSGATDYLSTAADFANNGDQRYEGRDYSLSGWTDEGLAASWASGLVHRRWDQPTYTSANLVTLAESWGNVDGHSESLDLEYGPSWLRLNLPASWLSLYNFCRQAPDESKQYRLCNSLAMAVYGSGPLRDLVPVLVAFATNPSFLHLTPPDYVSYRLSDGYEPTIEGVQKCVSDAVLDPETSPSGSMPRSQNESYSERDLRQSTDYNSNISRLIPQLTQDLFDCWPGVPNSLTGDYSSWFDLNTGLESVKQYFKSCSKNAELRVHLQQVEQILCSSPSSAGLERNRHESALPRSSLQIGPKKYYPNDLRIEFLMEHRAGIDSGPLSCRSSLCVSEQIGSPIDTTRLCELLAEFNTDQIGTLRRCFGAGLETSRVNLAQVNHPTFPSQLLSTRRLERYHHLCRDSLEDSFEDIRRMLEPCTPVETVASTSGIWPRLTPRAILGRLALRTRPTTPPGWQNAIAGYAQIFMEYQRSQRLIGLALENKHEEFCKELGVGSGNHDSRTDHPDWMLIQVRKVICFWYQEGEPILARSTGISVSELYSPRWPAR
jgi:hypothetical protein